VALLALFSVILVSCSATKRKRRRKLTLYCSAQIEWCELAKNEFEKKSGIRVSTIRKSSGEMYAQIWAERQNPKGDVWWAGTGDAHIQAAEARLTEPYQSPRLKELHPWAVDPAGHGEHRATGLYMGALGFGYNKEWLAKKGLDPPKSWADLISPNFRGEIQMANPNSSGTAYTALATIVQLFGEAEGFEYLKKLHANINQYTKSGAAPVRAAARGEAGVGIVFLHDATTQKIAGFPIEIIAPEEGTGFEIGCVSIIRGSRHADEARAFVDWALGTDAQNLAGQVRSYQIPSNKEAEIPADAPRLEIIKLIDFDFEKYDSKKERTRLLRRWENEVKASR
jgi:iron(III) transport system substrate-binding protein